MKVNGQNPDYTAIANDPDTQWMLSPTVCICGCPQGIHTEPLVFVDGSKGTTTCYGSLPKLDDAGKIIGHVLCECTQYMSQREYFRRK